MPIGAGAAQAIQTGGNIFGQMLANRANRQEADKARAYNKQMWEAQNLYNSPEQQMARLKAAGLNPNLVYGKGAGGNAAGPASPVGAPKMGAPNLNLDILGKYQQLSSLKNDEINRQNTEANTKLYNATTTMKMTENAIKSIDLTIRGIDERVAKDFRYEGAYRDLGIKKTREKMEQEKFQLTMLQSELAKQSLALGAKKLKWFDPQQWGRMVGTAAGSAFGLSRLGKFGKLGKFTKGKAPKLKTPVRRNVYGKVIKTPYGRFSQ